MNDRINTTPAEPLANEQIWQDLLVELAEAKAQLEEERIRTEAMINSLGEGLIVTNEHGEITRVNAYALSSLGFREEELLGAWFPRTIMAVDRDLKPIDQLARPIIRALTSGQAISDYAHYLKKDGTVMPVFMTVSPFMIGGKPAGAIEVFRDLTDEQQLDIAKEEFVSLASHQLRTPATGVMAILSMLAAGDFGPLTPLQMKYLQKAIRNNNHQLSIIEDLLNAARVDAGKMQLDPEPTDLAALVREAAGDEAPLLESRQQTITVTTPRSCQMIADGHKLRMVLNNLISNAGKYSHPGGHINVTLTAKPRTAIITVTDQGVGIPEVDMPKLFTKFTRLENELSTEVGGTGLGLFLARSIVELHHGSIRATSRIGRGTTFTVELPRHRETP